MTRSESRARSIHRSANSIKRINASHKQERGDKRASQKTPLHNSENACMTDLLLRRLAAMFALLPRSGSVDGGALPAAHCGFASIQSNVSLQPHGHYERKRTHTKACTYQHT